MKHRWGLLAALGLLFLAAACLLHPVVRWRLIGWARGEAFYDARPTSYWKQAIDSSYVEFNMGGEQVSIWMRAPSQVEGWLAYWRGSDPDVEQPALQNNDPAGLPVLVALLADESVSVRRFAAHALRRLGPQAWPAAPAILRATEDEDERVRRDASVAWDQLVPPPP